MKTLKLCDGGMPVSRVGLGGHYRAMEEGVYEERTAYIEAEISHRTALVETALTEGITYFDTTWRNEAELLAHALRNLGCRDKVWINGMVLGAFTGSAHFNMSLSEYFDKWLDYRMAALPGSRFDSVMINAIEEGFDHCKCEKLIQHLEGRRQAGDFRLLGFSTHNPKLARELVDRYPEFSIVMLPYNFRNRAFAEAFAGCEKPVSVVAMKPLVWAEYGVPFCAANRLPAFEALFGWKPDLTISTKALQYILAHEKISLSVCAANHLDEVRALAKAGEGTLSDDDMLVLQRYNHLQTTDRGLPVFLGGLLVDNLRANFFSCSNLARVLGELMPHIPLNEDDSHSRIMSFAKSLLPKVAEAGYGRYLEGYSL